MKNNYEIAVFGVYKEFYITPSGIFTPIDEE